MEENEKLRYMNFVTLGRRPRAQSAVVNPTQARPSESVTSTPAISASAESTSTHRPLTQSNSIPLASSHDTTPLKDDLLPAHRSRSNSFAGRDRMSMRDNLCILDMFHMIFYSPYYRFSESAQERPVGGCCWVCTRFPMASQAVSAHLRGCVDPWS